MKSPRISRAALRHSWRRREGSNTTTLKFKCLKQLGIADALENRRKTSMRAFGMDQLRCYSIGISYETGEVNAHGDDARGLQTCSILHCILRK